MKIDMKTRDALFQELKNRQVENISPIDLQLRADLEAEQLRKDRVKAKAILDEILEKALKNMVSRTTGPQI